MPQPPRPLLGNNRVPPIYRQPLFELGAVVRAVDNRYDENAEARLIERA
jgi:hypothetical protein